MLMALAYSQCLRLKRNPIRANQRGWRLFFGGSASVGGFGRTWGRPIGQSVDNVPVRSAVSSIHSVDPKGLPRREQRRIAASSFSESGSLTRAIQFGRRGIGQAERTVKATITIGAIHEGTVSYCQKLRCRQRRSRRTWMWLCPPQQGQGSCLEPSKKSTVGVSFLGLPSWAMEVSSKRAYHERG